jgi:hypothetical protein
MTLAVVVVKDRRRPRGFRRGLNRAMAYADGVPDSGSAVSIAVKEVDLGS